MAGLDVALLQGVSGFMRGRQQRQRQDIEDARYEQEQAQKTARENEQMAMQRELRDAQIQAMRDAQAARQEAAARQQMQDERSAYEGGYRPAAETQQLGAAMSQVGATGNPMANAAGAMLQGRAKGPSAYTLGGVPMVKGAESMQEAQSRRQMEIQDARAKEQRQQHLDDVKAQQDFQRAQQDRSFAQQRDLLGTRLDATTGQPKTLPMGVESELSENISALHSIQQAQQMMSAKGADDHFGLMRGAQNAIGMANRFDKSGTEVRSLIANLGSQQIKLRSGAAVTASEWPRLAPWIPSIHDSPDEIRVKLQKMGEVIADETNARTQYYQQQGYAVPTVPGGAPQRPPLDSFNRAPGGRP